jgi:predicted RNA-binding Zn ribbon-like protein
MDEQMTDDTALDGNALAGPLRELFAVDLTVARGRCAGCGRVDVVAELRVYADAPGLVARCPSCDAVMLRLVRAPDRAWLDLRGVVALEVPMPESS